jgi:uncharacterized protein involved in exopolysaccharide biosynthesis
MNTPLKVDFTPRPPRRRVSAQAKRWDYRAHYADLAARTLSSIVRHRWFIAKFVVVTLALACISISLIPRKYSAEALIYPSLFSREQDKVVALASVDGAAMVTGEARLIRSDAVVRAVAMRLGHDPGAKSRSWATLPLDWLRAAFLPETRNDSPFDRAAALLRDKVVVMNDTRSYLISISFTASTADEAAQVVNAFVTEYLRYKTKQRELEKMDFAEAELRRQLAVYGDKHPKTLQAVAELDAQRASQEATMNQRVGDQDDVANDRGVKLAVPNQTPTSPRGFVILGLSFLSALLAGIGLAVWRDRREAERKQTVGYQPASPIART